MKLRSAIIPAALLAAAGMSLETTQASTDTLKPSQTKAVRATPKLKLPARNALRCPPGFKQTSLKSGGMGGALVCEQDINWTCPSPYNGYYQIEGKQVAPNRYKVRLVCGYIG